jgi:hypothetical protein
MFWLQHLFAIWLLAHMLWAAVLLEREWRRVRRFAGSEDQSSPTGAEAPQASTLHT